jgi:DNA-binding GntR family transcriptional regulator
LLCVSISSLALISLETDSGGISNNLNVLTMHTLYSLEKDMLHEVTRTTPGAIIPSRHSFDYHQKILKALREKKPQKVYDLTFEHILVVLRAVKKLEEHINKDERFLRKTI